MIGIVTCYYFLHGLFTNAHINNAVYAAAGVSIAGLWVIAQLSNFKKYRSQFLQGLLLQIVFLCLGISMPIGGMANYLLMAFSLSTMLNGSLAV